MRAYVERCNNPPVKKLLTFGTPHAGFSEIPSCSSPAMKPVIDSLKEDLPFIMRWFSGIACNWIRSRLIDQAYSDWLQDKLMPAQYFRDPDRLEEYRKKSAFLADINCEKEKQNCTSYAKNMQTLDGFYMFAFELDEYVNPRGSAV